MHSGNVLQNATNIYDKVTIHEHTNKGKYHYQEFNYIHVGLIHEEHALLQNANTGYNYNHLS